MVKMQSTHTAKTPEKLVRLVDVPRAVPWLANRPNGQQPISVATLYRWASRGLRGVRLATWAQGATLCTTERALLEFMEKLALGRSPTPADLEPAGV